jgi:hypothetical protein
MIVKLFKRSIILIIVAVVAGCANSSLKMELSIYKDDPLFKNVITKDDLKGTRLYLDQVNSELDAVLQMELNAANEIYKVFDAYWMAQGQVAMLSSGKAYDDAAQQSQADALVPLSKRLRSYKQRLQIKASEVRSRLAQANATYDGLIAILPKNLDAIDFTKSTYIGQVRRQQRQQQVLSIEVSKVHQSLNVIVNDPNDPFYESTKRRWKRISVLVESASYKKHLASTERLKLKKKIIEAAQQFNKVTSTLVSVRTEMSASIKLAINSNEPLALIDKMMDNPTIYQYSAQEETRMLQAVDLLNSQLDRFQNSSSPVWRIVTDPKNEKKWNTEFSKTYFYAEGDAGVVIVRDSPIKYRVQEASNNPAALVQAQLQVSRAVADAAIQIAGARTGIPLASATKAADKTVAQSDNTDYQQQTENLMTKRAEIKAKKVVYQKSITAMEANIDSYLRQLADLKAADKNGNDNDKDAITSLNNKIILYLKAQQALLASAKVGE